MAQQPSKFTASRDGPEPSQRLKVQDGVICGWALVPHVVSLAVSMLLGLCEQYEEVGFAGRTEGYS